MKLLLMILLSLTAPLMFIIAGYFFIEAKLIIQGAIFVSLGVLAMFFLVVVGES